MIKDAASANPPRKKGRVLHLRLWQSHGGPFVLGQVRCGCRLSLRVAPSGSPGGHLGSRGHAVATVGADGLLRVALAGDDARLPVMSGTVVAVRTLAQ